MSAPIAPGSSGGPIFNDRGEVVGICEAILRGGQNLNFGTPAKYLRALLDDPKPVPVGDFAAAAGPDASGGHEPVVTRKVPVYPTTLLKGCNSASLRLIVRTIQEAIEVGAPLYNSGNHAGCYHIYEGAAADLEQRLPRQCVGATTALAAGRSRAAAAGGATEQAWAMRDAFDGMIDVVSRKLNAGNAPAP